METLVVGLAKAVLETLVGWAGTAMADKAALLLGVHKDVRYIHDELPMMHAFLRASSPAYTAAAGFVNRSGDDLQNEWVKQLRNLACDIEDVLLDFTLLKGPSANLPGVAGQIAELKARVEDLHKRNHQYHAFVREDRNPRHDHDHAHDDSADTDPALLDEWRRQAIIGRDGDKTALTKLIPHPQDGVSVVALWGEPGVGKSSLARMLYDDTDLIKYFNHRAWVTVPHPLEDADEFGRLLQEQIGLDKQEIKRCLVVVDDVSTHQEWEHVSRCLHEKHADGQVVVLVTTHLQDVAGRRCAQYKLEPLPYNEAWKLLCLKVYKDAKYKLPNDTVKQAKFVLERCRGRPLAIAAIGGILANGPKKSSEWNGLKEYLMPELQSPALDVKRVISLNYYGLPYHVKFCLLYTSIFPQNHDIRHSRLLRRWMAELYIEKQHNMTLEKVARSQGRSCGRCYRRCSTGPADQLKACVHLAFTGQHHYQHSCMPFSTGLPPLLAPPLHGVTTISSSIEE